MNTAPSRPHMQRSLSIEFKGRGVSVELLSKTFFFHEPRSGGLLSESCALWPPFLQRHQRRQPSEEII
jgi:hypothetical protein